MTTPRRTDEIQGEIVHEYDGIEEADNQLPRWWLWTLYGAILFSIGYWVWFEAFAIGDDPMTAYNQAKLEALDRGGPVTDDELLEIAADPLMVEAGQKAFGTHCVKCHGSKGEGVIGPNLTDPFWLYGGSPASIHESVDRGRKGGMPAWGPNLGGGGVKQVTAYLLSIQDTNVPGKEPQGKRYEPPSTEPAAEDPGPGSAEAEDNDSPAPSRDSPGSGDARASGERARALPISAGGP